MSEKSLDRLEAELPESMLSDARFGLVSAHDGEAVTVPRAVAVAALDRLYRDVEVLEHGTVEPSRANAERVVIAQCLASCVDDWTPTSSRE